MSAGDNIVGRRLMSGSKTTKTTTVVGERALTWAAWLGQAQ